MRKLAILSALLLTSCQSYKPAEEPLSRRVSSVLEWKSAAVNVLEAKAPEVSKVSISLETNSAWLEFKFSEPMQRVAIEGIKYTTSPKLPCVWYWTDERHLTCDVEEGVSFQPATAYTINIEGGLYSKQGKKFDSYSYKFESPRPVLENYHVKWIAPTSPEISAKFNFGVNPESLKESLYLLDSRGNITLLNAFPDESNALDDDYLPRNKNSRWILKPVKRLKAGASYHLYQASGITTPHGKLNSTKKRITDDYRKIESYGAFRLEEIKCYRNNSCPPEFNQTIKFSAPIIPDEFEKCEADLNKLGVSMFIRRNADTSITVSPSFPAVTKRLKCLESITDVFGRQLNKDTIIEITTGNYEPFHHSPYAEQVITKKDELELRHQSVNYDKIEVDILEHDFTATEDETYKRRTLMIESETNEIDDTNILPDELRSATSVGGVVRVSPDKWTDKRFFVQKTGYNAIVQKGQNSILAFLGDIKTNEPLRNTEFTVDFVFQDNQHRAITKTKASRTDEFGMALIPSPKNEFHLAHSTSLVFKLNNGDKFAVRYGHKLDPDIAGDDDYEPREDGSEIFWGITDKPLYRPGETVKYTGFLRRLNGANIELMELSDDSVLYVNGSEVECYRIESCDSFHINRKVNQDEFGRISGEFKLPSSVSDGRYAIALDKKNFYDDYINELFFDVANFKRQKLKVSVEPQVKGTLTEEQFAVTTKAEYYSGGPYSNADAEIGLSIESGDFGQEFEEHRNFYFNPNSSTDEFNGQHSYYFSGGSLNQEGIANVDISVPPSNINYGELQLSSTLTTDEGEKVLSRPESVSFSRRNHYVGIQKLDWWLAANKETIINARVVELNGDTKSGVNVSYYIKKIDDFWGRKSEETSSEKTPLNCKSVLNTKPDLSDANNQCIFTQKYTGYYQLIAEIVYPDGSSQHSATTHYFYSDDDQTESTLVVQASEDVLQVGDKATLKIKHGIKNATALVTIHRGELLDSWWQPLTDGLNKITFDVKDSYAPGFDVTVFVNYSDLEKERGADNPNYAQVITQRFKVKTPDSIPLVKIDDLEEEHKPGAQISLNLNNLTNEKASVILAVIDESIIDQLENNEYYKVESSYLRADELSWVSPQMFELAKGLYAARSQELTFDEEYGDDKKITITGSRISRTDVALSYAQAPAALSMEALSDNFSQSQGANSGKSVQIRKLFKESAYWNNKIVISANGFKKLDIKLPDNLTQWKVIGLSTTKGGNIFVDEKTIKTSKDLEVHTQLPSQLTKGDHFELQAEVVSKSDNIKQISMSSSARQMPADSLINQTTKKFNQVAAFKRNKIKMEVNAQETGDIEILTVAESSIENDGVMHSSKVYSKNLTRSQSYYSLLPEDTQVQIDTPKDYSLREGKLQFSLSGSVLSNLGGTFDYMKKYPHQCWEQKLSRAVVAAINIESGAAKEDRELLDSQIKDAINSIGEFQASNGGMAFFGKSEDFVSSYLSAHTYKSIQYLNNKGIHFSNLNTQKLKKYLVELLKDKKADMTLELASIIVNALASNEENQQVISEYMPTLIKSHTTLDVFSRSQILESASAYPEYQQELVLLQNSLLDDSRVTDKKRLFKEGRNLPWYFYDFGVKKYCSTISSLVATKTDKKTVNQFVNGALELRRKNKGDFGNTLTNAYCSMAISDYVKEYEKGSAIGQFNLSVQDNNILVSKEHSMKEAKISMEEPILINIESKNSGIGYLQATLEYSFDGSKAAAVSNGFAIERTYSKRDNGKWIFINKKNIQQGDFVKVRLKINNPLFRRFVAITDTLPGTFFALDESLSTSAPAELFEELEQDYYFREKQLSTRNAKFYADYLPAGKHVVEYLVKVTHKGEFSALSAKVEEMYDDDVFATSKPTRVIVH